MEKASPLKLHRMARGLTQQELAKQVGASRQAIGSIERGEGNPNIRLCIKICKMLCCTLDDLFYNHAKQIDRDDLFM